MDDKNIYVITGVIEDKPVVFLKKSIGSYLEENIPLNNATELSHFLKKLRKRLRIYKTRSGAERFICKFKSHYKITNELLIEVVCITEEMRHPVFTGCPKCQSLEVVEIHFVEYNRLIRFDVEENLAMRDSRETPNGESIESYSCAKCGYDLDEYEIDSYDFKDVGNY